MLFTGNQKNTGSDLSIRLNSHHIYQTAPINQTVPFLGTTVVSVGMNKQQLVDALAVPKDVLVFFDKSYSMVGRKILKASEAVRALRNRLGIDDRLAIVGFDEDCEINEKYLLYDWANPKVVKKKDFFQGLANLISGGSDPSVGSVTNALGHAVADGMTAYYPALSLTKKMFNRLTPVSRQVRRQVVIIITDGDMNHGKDPIPLCKELRESGYIVCAIGIEQNNTGEDLLQKMVGPAYFFGLDSAEKLESTIVNVQGCFSAAVVTNARLVVKIPSNSLLLNQHFDIATVMSKKIVDDPTAKDQPAGRPFEIPMIQNEIELGNLVNGVSLRVFFIGQIDTHVTPGEHTLMQVELHGKLNHSMVETLLAFNAVTVDVGPAEKLHSTHETLSVLADSARALSAFGKCKQSRSVQELKTYAQEARQTTELGRTEFDKILNESISAVLTASETSLDQAQTMSRQLSTETWVDAMTTGMMIIKLAKDDEQK